ncbi:MAG: hypothetical protein AB7V16_07120 [Vulcanibacillus sp.]
MTFNSSNEVATYIVNNVYETDSPIESVITGAMYTIIGTTILYCKRKKA